MRKALAGLVMIASLLSGRVAAAQGLGVRVQGVELAAAANLSQHDIKIEGRIFLPQQSERVRAVIVAMDWGLGAAFYADPQVRGFVGATSCGLVLARVSEIRSGAVARVVNDASLGGAEAMVNLLREFAKASGHQELINAPLLIFGQSAAGPFGAGFAAAYPDRTLAFIRYHSGPVLGGDLTAVKEIPALFFVGGKDTAVDAAGIPGVQGAEKLWTRGRAMDAPWTFALEPEATHGGAEHLEKASALTIPWMTAILRQRLMAGSTLRAIPRESAWLGNNRTTEIGTLSTSSHWPKAEASWLPDESSARGWRIVTGTAQ